MTGTFTELGFAAVIFVAGHGVLSGPALRPRLVGVLGKWGFLALYSAISLGLFMWMTRAYGAAPEVNLWQTPMAVRILALGVMGVVCVLVVAGATTPNPTIAVADSGAVAGRGPVGILKVTRYPILWGIGLWGLTHMAANGDVGSLILFGALTVLALNGTRRLDRKKRAQLGDAWAAFEAQTSNLPLAALFQGRTRVSLSEVGFWRLALALILYGVLLAFHEQVIGVSPLLP